MTTWPGASAVSRRFEWAGSSKAWPTSAGSSHAIPPMPWVTSHWEWPKTRTIRRSRSRNSTGHWLSTPASPRRTRRAAALADREPAAALRPDDAVSLDRLGQTYLALDRAADAVRVLRKAAALAPGDSKTQLHLARALADAGQTAESKAAMDRFRQLGPVISKAVPGGLVDYLSLTPEQRRADYRRRLERVVREHPEDAAAQVDYLRLLLQEGESPQAVEVARQIAALKPAAPLLADAGRALLEARQYAPARELLEKAVAGAADVELDLAIAAFHAAGPAEGTRLLGGVPEAARGGDYYLARAEMLNASGNAAESSAALEQALRRSPRQSGLYLEACSFLLRTGRTDEAVRVSEQAMQAFAKNRQILLLRAVVLEQAARGGEAESLLERIQNGWPGRQVGCLAPATSVARHARGAEPRAALSTALALGSQDPQVRHYLQEISAGREAQPPDLTLLLLSKPSQDR